MKVWFHQRKMSPVCLGLKKKQRSPCLEELQICIARTLSGCLSFVKSQHAGVVNACLTLTSAAGEGSFRNEHKQTWVGVERVSLSAIGKTRRGQEQQVAHIYYQPTFQNIRHSSFFVSTLINYFFSIKCLSMFNIYISLDLL